MSSILNLNLGDAKEPTVVETDKEVKIRIVACKQDKDKNGNGYILPTFEVPSIETAKEFTKFLSLGNKEDSPKQANKRKWALKCFFEAFGIDHTRKLNVEKDLPGATAWAILGVETDEEFGDKNYVKRFIAKK